jgi:micrococcal nuclease
MMSINILRRQLQHSLLMQLGILQVLLLTQWGKPVHYTFQANLIKVIDGDTIEIEYKNQRKRVRLSFIDAPESDQLSLNSQCLAGEMSTNYLKKRLKACQGKVSIKYFGTDRYRRLLGELYCQQKNLNLALVKQGQAIIYPYAKFLSKSQKRSYLNAAEYAKRNGLGFYFCGGIENPRYYRQNSSSKKTRIKKRRGRK